MNLFLKLVIPFLLLTGIVSAQSNDFYKKADDFFGKHVSNGLVDYKGICANPTELNNLVDMIASAEVSSATNNYQSFYINAYNILVIKGITKNYPVKKPTDVKGFFDSTKYKVAGEQLTLNDIENKKLRAKYPNEPKFHFVLVCAGLGCPPIIDDAYTPDNVQSLLEKQTKRAINDPKFIKINRDNKEVKISQIFEWYKEDFLKHGSYVDFLNKFLKDPISEDYKVSFYNYDWNLNSQN